MEVTSGEIVLKMISRKTPVWKHFGLTILEIVAGCFTCKISQMLRGAGGLHIQQLICNVIIQPMLLSANEKVECGPFAKETVSLKRKPEVQPALGHVIFRLLKSSHLNSIYFVFKITVTTLLQFSHRVKYVL
jgi:hypothetical protein